MSKRAIQYWKEFSKDKYDFLKDNYNNTIGEDSKLTVNSKYAKFNRKLGKSQLGIYAGIYNRDFGAYNEALKDFKKYALRQRDMEFGNILITSQSETPDTEFVKKCAVNFGKAFYYKKVPYYETELFNAIPFEYWIKKTK